jgi:hypothetical protein
LRETAQEETTIAFQKGRFREKPDMSWISPLSYYAAGDQLSQDHSLLHDENQDM